MFTHKYSNPQAGDRVFGTYFGVPFTGVVTKLRFHGVTREAMWYVDTDQPVKTRVGETYGILVRLPDAMECINGTTIQLVDEATV